MGGRERVQLTGAAGFGVYKIPTSARANLVSLTFLVQYRLYLWKHELTILLSFGVEFYLSQLYLFPCDCFIPTAVPY